MVKREDIKSENVLSRAIVITQGTREGTKCYGGGVWVGKREVGRIKGDEIIMYLTKWKDHV